ncbi:hypothetical protein D9615_008971 [Tricholomella constricta]|uniref:Uncharacterized protein n=1 Tax=Tricholomella constricta TaxID=117010 RepID=A0A8H5H0S5_9AGAR|nr:hypothetical protein D9615_008971 [Tricholomella constricta]
MDTVTPYRIILKHEQRLLLPLTQFETVYESLFVSSIIVSTMSAKQQKISGLSAVVVNAIQALVQELQQEQSLNREAAELDSQLDGVLKELQAKVDHGPQSYSSSNTTEDYLDLEEMGIFFSGLLDLKPDAISRGVKTDSLGADSLWSSDMLYRHLQFLKGLVPQGNEAAARLWINAFLYRVAFMIPSGLNVVLSVDHTPSGYVDSTAMVMSPQKARLFLQELPLHYLENEYSAFFVSEAKGPDPRLRKHVPQAVVEMLSCARSSGKTTIRGVVTNGHSWSFIILKLDENGGGSYFRSKALEILNSIEDSISKEAVSTTSAIIAHWMVHSHAELDVENDYFCPELSPL